jgi:hypothetical protein
MDIERKRENIYLPKFLCDKVVEYGKEIGLNKSATYTVIIKQFFDSQDVIRSLPNILERFKKEEELKLLK